MPKTSVYINSVNRTQGTANDFMTTLKRALNNVSRVEIKSIEIPFTYYTVNSNNNTIQFTDNVPNTYSCTLTPGYYNADQLLTEIESKMTAQLAGFTGGSYDENKLKFTIANGTNDFEILDSTTTTAQALIGLDGDTGVVSSWTSDNAINIMGTNHIYIFSNALISGRNIAYADSDMKDIIYRVPVDVDFGSVIRERTEAYQSNVFEYDTANRLHNIDFRLTNEDYNALDLNGWNWSIELQVTHSD